MVNIKKNLIVAALGLGASALTPAAFAIPLDGLLGVDASIVTIDGTVTYLGGSYFNFGSEVSPGGSLGPSIAAGILRPGSDGGILLGQYQNFVLDPDVPHPQGYLGDNTSPDGTLNGTLDGMPDPIPDGIPEGRAGEGYGRTPTTQANILQPFRFFTGSVYSGTNPIAYQSGLSHPVPTADVDLSSCDADNVCTLTLDISAWEVEWNGAAFEQGSRPVKTGPFELATGTYDLDTRFYSITWFSQINQGPFDDVIGVWHLEGTHVPVPVPAAAWLLGSGLLGLAGIARRKKK